MSKPSYRMIVTQTWLSQKPDSSGFLIASVVTLLLALASVFYWNNYFGSNDWMPVSQNGLYQQQHAWQAFTALFAHADEKHLVSNSFLFFILGGFLAGHFGFVLFPLLAFLAGGLINYLVVLNMDPAARLLGASGIVFWMGGAWLSLYFLLDIKHSLYQRSLRAIGVSLLLFFPAQAFEPQISYMSHSLGFLFGVFSGIGFYYFNRQKFLAAVSYRMVIDEDIPTDEPLPESVPDHA